MDVTRNGTQAGRFAALLVRAANREQKRKAAKRTSIRRPRRAEALWNGQKGGCGRAASKRWTRSGRVPWVRIGSL